jgi:hypothetical protein
MSNNLIVKINTALSNRPYFVKIADPDYSIDQVFSEAIKTLKNSGRPLEGAQLEQLYQNHQIFNGGREVQKGELFHELKLQRSIANQQEITIAELDLIASHAGG